MSSFKDKLKNMAADKKIAAHPLVNKLNANQNTRSSYWLAFALYAKVEEKKLDTQLTDLGKSLKLDDTEIKDELSAVNGCSADEDFESLVQECANGIADSTTKILLFVELNQFGKRNKMSLDFLPDMMSIMELPDSAKDFVNEFNTIVNSTKPNLLNFYNLTKKFPDIPVFVYESFASDLWTECSKDLSKEASVLAKIITKNFSDEFWKELLLNLENDAEESKSISFADLKNFYSAKGYNSRAVNFFADQGAMEKKHKEIEDSFTKEYHDVQISLVNRYVFQQYKQRQQALFSAIESYIAIAEPGDGGYVKFSDKLYEFLSLKWYMIFAAGLKEDFFEDVFRFLRYADFNADLPENPINKWSFSMAQKRNVEKNYKIRYDAALEKARQAALKELNSIIAVYEEENKKLSASLG